MSDLIVSGVSEALSSAPTAPIFQFVDATGNILADLNDWTGANNPHMVITKAQAPDLQTPATEFNFFSPSSRPGGRLARKRDPLVTTTFIVSAKASSVNALERWAGEIIRLTAAGGIFKYLPVNATEQRWFDYESGTVSALSRTNDPAIYQQGWDIAFEVVLYRQPYLRSASTTLFSDTVPNNPALANGMAFVVTNPGDAPMPATLTVTADTGAQITGGIIASMQGTDHANFVETRKAFQCEAGTLSADTTSVVHANASDGNYAWCQFTTDPTIMAKRVRMQATTLLDSYRGKSFDVYLRAGSGKGENHVVQLRWSPSTEDPVNISEAPVTLDAKMTSLTSFYPVKLGRIFIPDKPLSGVTLELWAQRTTGTSTLSMDALVLVPVERQTRLTVPGGSMESWNGSECLTPSNPAGLTAGTVIGDFLLTDANTEAGGTPPNTGLVWGASRHRVTFNLDLYRAAGTVSYTYRVRNITDSTDAATVSTSFTSSNTNAVKTLYFDGVAGKAYQAQVIHGGGSGNVTIKSIDHEVIPRVASGQKIVLDEDGTVIRATSTGTPLGPVTAEGPSPLTLPPGESVVVMFLTDAPNDVWTLDRTPTVEITGSPRYYH